MCRRLAARATEEKGRYPSSAKDLSAGVPPGAPVAPQAVAGNANITVSFRPPPVAEEDLEHFRRETAAAAATGRGVVATFGGTAFGDIALVPAPWLKHPKGIRDVTEWYVSTKARRDYVDRIFERCPGPEPQHYAWARRALGVGPNPVG